MQIFDLHFCALYLSKTNLLISLSPLPSPPFSVCPAPRRSAVVGVRPPFHSTPCLSPLTPGSKLPTPVFVSLLCWLQILLPWLAVKKKCITCRILILCETSIRLQIMCYLCRKWEIFIGLYRNIMFLLVQKLSCNLKLY